MNRKSKAKFQKAWTRNKSFMEFARVKNEGRRNQKKFRYIKVPYCLLIVSFETTCINFRFILRESQNLFFHPSFFLAPFYTVHMSDQKSGTSSSRKHRRVAKPSSITDHRNKFLRCPGRLPLSHCNALTLTTLLFTLVPP